MLHQQAAEDPAGDADEADRREGRHGCGPGTAVQQGDLPEEVAGPQARLGLAADRDLALPVQDQEQPDPPLALKTLEAVAGRLRSVSKEPV